MGRAPAHLRSGGHGAVGARDRLRQDPRRDGGAAVQPVRLVGAHDRGRGAAGAAGAEVGVVRVPELPAAVPAGPVAAVPGDPQAVLLQPAALRRAPGGVSVGGAAETRPAPAAAPARGLVPGIRFVLRNRMATPRYLVLWLRYLWRFKVRNRHIVTHGMVFVARRAEVYCRRGLGHMELGRWVWIGAGNALRCHEGFFRVGDKVVFGANNTLNGYLDI